MRQIILLVVHGTREGVDDDTSSKKRKTTHIKVENLKGNYNIITLISSY